MVPNLAYKFWKIAWRFILPLVFLYLGRSEIALVQLQENGIIGNKVDCEVLRHVFFGIGIAIGLVFVPVSLYLTEYKNKKLEKALLNYLGYNKDAFIGLLRNILENPDAFFNVRVFNESGAIKDRIYKLVGGDVFFRINNLVGLSKNDETNDLVFRVKSKSKDTQGLVGLTYLHKKIFYDFDVQRNLKKNPYNLTEFQKSKTSRTKFVLTAPIFDNKNNVIAVISIDSENNISKPVKKVLAEIEHHVIYYCQNLHEQMPVIINECN